MCCFRDCTCICHSRNFRGNPCGRNVRKHKRVRRQEEYQQGELHNHAGNLFNSLIPVMVNE